jgi:hypothetical protein
MVTDDQIADGSRLPRVIMEITGHSRGEVFDRYNQVSLDDMRQAISKLTEYRKAQSASVDQNVDQIEKLG